MSIKNKFIKITVWKIVNLVSKICEGMGGEGTINYFQPKDLYFSTFDIKLFIILPK